MWYDVTDQSQSWLDMNKQQFHIYVMLKASMPFDQYEW